MDCSMPGFPVLLHLPELVQTGLMHDCQAGGEETRRERQSQGSTRGAGDLTLLIWSWVFLILWSSGVSATTLKPLPLFFSNSSL